jgi:hypothetical protein
MNDILLDTNGDLSIKNGDFEIGYSNNQHQEHILLANKGEFKEFPEIGVGIAAMIGDDDYMDMLIEIKKNLEYDGMEVKNVRFDENGNLDIDGDYTTNG